MLKNFSKRPVVHTTFTRKLSFGTKTAQGSRFVETILTAVETCHRQSRNSFAYLTTAIEPTALASLPVHSSPRFEQFPIPGQFEPMSARR